MNPATATLSALEELEIRQDELLEQLDVLERRIARVLDDYVGRTGPGESRAAPTLRIGSPAPEE
jgi:hypothetical protein